MPRTVVPCGHTPAPADEYPRSPRHNNVSILQGRSMTRVAPCRVSFVLAGFLLALSGCAPTRAPEVPVSRQAPTGPVSAAIASFNMGWAGTPAEFARYVQVCSAPAVNYCDTRPWIDRGAKVATDAEKARAAQCQQATQAAAGGRDASMKVPPCNAYRPPRPASGSARVDPAVSR